MRLAKWPDAMAAVSQAEALLGPGGGHDVLRRRSRMLKDDQDWKRLLAAARAADPDPWRNRVREAWERGERKALSDLTKSAPFDRLHPCDVLLLEANLDTLQAVAVLREAQRRRPGDFWL